MAGYYATLLVSWTHCELVARCGRGRRGEVRVDVSEFDLFNWSDVQVQCFWLLSTKLSERCNEGVCQF